MNINDIKKNQKTVLAMALTYNSKWIRETKNKNNVHFFVKGQNGNIFQEIKAIEHV